jgi:DNA-binding beta-propeller fold protein YncE
MQHRNGHETSKACVECEVPQLARNHYFTGKMLLESDLTAEQCFHIGKQRRHNQRLHGWGVVCGLRVVPHETPACQPRYVRIEPGTAIDCCGHEIQVHRTELFDFRAAAEAAFERAEREGTLGDGPHRLQICIRYDECPTEEVPVLFDDCATGEECQPNRIVERHAFDVVLDAEVARDDPAGPRLDHAHTVNIALAHRVALDDSGGRLYVATADDPGRLYVLDSGHHAIVTAYTLPAMIDDLALSPDGARAYVTVQAAAGAEPVLVLDTAKLNTSDAVVRRLGVDNFDGAGLRVAVSPADGRLFVLNPQAREVTTWDGSVGGSGQPPPAGRISVGDGAAGMALSPSGRWLLVPNAVSGSITVADTETLTTVGPIELEAGASPASVAVGETSGGLRVFVADGADHSIRALGFAPGSGDPFPAIGAPQPLAQAPVELAASSGGRWLYVLERDGDAGVVQVVDAHRLQLGRPGAAGAATPIGDRAGDLLLAPGGRRLYAAYRGAAAPAGGVAVVDVAEERCAELLERAGEPCPACSGDDCLVLATVEGWRAGDPLTDDRIDNRRGRRLLASTALLTDVVECILERGVGEGERGAQGPPGPPGATGAAGPGFTSASVAHGKLPTVTPNQPAPGNLDFRLPVVTGVKATEGDPAQTTYDEFGVIHLKIPKGDTGSTGPGFTQASVSHGKAPKVTPNGPSLDFELPVVTGVVATEGAPAGTSYDEFGVIHLKVPKGDEGPQGELGPGFTKATVVHGFPPAVAPSPADAEQLDFRLPVVKSADAGPGPVVAANYDQLAGHIHFEFPFYSDVALTRICGVSWEHGGKLAIGSVELDSLFILFTQPVKAEDLHPLSLRVLARKQEDPQDELKLACWCELQGDVQPWDFEVPCVPERGGPAQGPSANAVRFHRPAGFAVGTYRVQLNGDFVRTFVDPPDPEAERAVDADHLPPWFGHGLAESGDGIEGGTFESWFEVVS